MINKIWNWIKNIFKPEKQDPHLEDGHQSMITPATSAAEQTSHEASQFATVVV